MAIKGFVLVATMTLAACASAARREEAEVARTRKRLAAEVERICAADGGDREALLNQLKEQTGMELYCADN